MFAAAGSAIGLGNIWRFPYSAGENGGGAFVLVYLAFVMLIGLPVLWAELAVGRATERNAFGAFAALGSPRGWPLVGALGVITGFGILAFYSVVAGWTVAYVYEVSLGELSRSVDAETSERVFNALIGDAVWPMALAFLFIVLTALVVRGGVAKGIERATKILMPAFALLLVVLAIRSLTLPNAMQGVEFLFAPDFGKLTPRVVMSALGQALFSLSLGMGVMITYGSYLKRDENLIVAGASVALFDTTIAVLAGLIIFPALFSVGVDPKGGAGLVFVVLPAIFDQLPAGGAFAIAFYVLLAIAALTSTISMMEVVVAYLVDERGWSRELSVWSASAGSAALAIPSALSFGANEFLSGFLGKGFLEINNILFGNFALSIGALMILIFVGWVWGIDRAIEELERGGSRLPAAPLFRILVRFICPLAVGGVLAFLAITGEFF